MREFFNFSLFHSSLSFDGIPCVLVYLFLHLCVLFMPFSLALLLLFVLFFFFFCFILFSFIILSWMSICFLLRDRKGVEGKAGREGGQEIARIRGGETTIRIYY